jgi:hypothetical protein
LPNGFRLPVKVLDAGGDIYGGTEFAGLSGYGTIDKLAQAGEEWTMTLLFSFDGGDEWRLPARPAGFRCGRESLWHHRQRRNYGKRRGLRAHWLGSQQRQRYP